MEGILRSNSQTHRRKTNYFKDVKTNIFFPSENGKLRSIHY